MKPRLVLFRSRYDPDLPDFLVAHSYEHIRCLQQSFDVTVVSGNCDYDAVCDIHKPDVSAFEIGLQLPDSRTSISNTHTHPRVPKIGLMNADAWGGTRSVILSDVENLQLNAVFSICTTTGEHLPAMSGQLFYWPNFVDTSVFRDYGLEKLVPIAITGASNKNYPWRQAIYPRIGSVYPTIVCPHRGYSKSSPRMQMLHGVAYAKVLASAWFSPTCGTAARELVRKHLEIPACKTALITEECSSIALAGFVDMENCVLADEHNVLDKISYLFDNPERLQQLIDAGHQLVVSRHTMRNRTQVADWFSLSRTLGPTQRLVQANPFESLSVAECSSAQSTLHLSSSGAHLGMIRTGDSLLRSKKIDEARAAYDGSLRVFDTLAEPQLRLVACDLLQGKPEEALRRVLSLLKYTLGRYEDVDPDPAEWAYLIVCLLCLGRVKAASRRVRQYAYLSHPDLDRVRTVVRLINPHQLGSTSLDSTRGSRGSLHTTLHADNEAWLSHLSDMLAACGRPTLSAATSATAVSIFQADVARTRSRVDVNSNRRESVRRPLGFWRPYLPGSGLLRGFDNPLLWSALVERFTIRLSWLRESRQRAD